MGLMWFSEETAIISTKSILMEKWHVFFVLGTEPLRII